MNCNKKRFTLRLTDEEFRELTRIKGLIGITTTTKAIRYIINHFAELNNRYIEEINKNAALKEKYKKQDRCIESLLKSISSLKELDDLKVVLPEKDWEKMNMGNHIIDLFSYDKYIVSFSGGKDSTATFLYLLDHGVPTDRIELWHQEIDGREKTFLIGR